MGFQEAGSLEGGVLGWPWGCFVSNFSNGDFNAKAPIVRAMFGKRLSLSAPLWPPSSGGTPLKEAELPAGPPVIEE